MKADSFHIRSKIESFNEGYVFSYQDLGNSDHRIRKMISRMTQENKLVALRNGLFLKPRYNKFLKRNLSATQADIVDAFLRKSDVLPAENTLFYKLKLTPQVPMRQTFLTNAETKQLKVGEEIFYLKKSPFIINSRNKEIVTILYLIRNLGKVFESTIDDQIKVIRSLISSLSEAKLIQLVNLSISKDRFVYSALLGAILSEMSLDGADKLISLLEAKINSRMFKVSFNAAKYLSNTDKWGIQN